MTTASLPLRHRLGNLYEDLVHRYQGLTYALGLTKTPIPHSVKRRVIREYAKRHGVRAFVETGTYLGQMIAAMAPHFDELHSVELSEKFFERAKLRFARNPRVHLHQGDSGEVLPRILTRLPGPALFWLDAHYSGGISARASSDTPVEQELRHLLADGRPHVILVDDSHLFNGTGDYPSMEQVKQLVASTRPGYTVELGEGIIRIAPATL